ncbi:AraC family transcriptional regulator [Clostridioides mangenotii]|uniref:helix-turn-helix domain-containing protein n=1 Tax=Metaclostridioides mangenotii TaxID=1540 RepID=UPI001C128B14|nr:AraC family transcriptional regulator [Clostridioides mangenotii]MBU5306933.1 AraC family transcriptional regulator [Clostridioides mangenotii]
MNTEIRYIKKQNKSYSEKAHDILAEFNNDPYQVVRVGYFVKKKSLDRNSYYTNLSAFIFPISGRANITLNNEQYVAEPGKLIHACPNKKISFEVLGDDPFEHINIYYSSDPRSKTTTNYMNTVFEMEVDNYIDIIDKLHKILEISYEPELISNLKLQLRVNIFLKDLFEGFSNKHYSDERSLVSSVIKYITENYMEEISLTKLETLFGVKSSRISYLFYKYTKTRPIDYLIKYRMSVATNLLEQEGYSVKKVSEAVGYTDEFYFSRLFKKNFGISPSKVKKRNHN